MMRWMLALAFGLSAAGMATDAHHSIAAVYDAGRQVTVDGAVTRFQFVNPHPLLTIEVVAAGGRTEWLLEMDNRSELAAIGVTAGTLKPGDRIVVTGSLARTQSNRLYVYRLDRPADGLRYEQIGGSPRIRSSSK